ncbi:MBL fold metallo-hydrolase [Isoptericola sediminis]|uniref:MBL fold metallo-hydrolase n=1 Tax=Isoptericola sediminis TaxID=2733572 RepID=A0A849JZP5_9MICO|nr:MBL fold metallo-hydrolase [Isoptericola sediminis]NNU28752.1 MBL fold metallo-hydrolase [Isoptericola sediminis]
MTFRAVAPDVLVRTSRRDVTTSVLAVGPRRATGRRPALLVDPAWDDDELEGMADELVARQVRVAAGLSTHAHHDHLLWHPRFGAVPRWASSRATEVVRSHRDVLDAVVRSEGRQEAVLELFAAVAALADDRVPDPDGELPRSELVVHDAHAPGHVALWLPDARVLVAGDMLSDVEPPLPADEISGDTDLVGYREGLERLAPYVARADVVVPGHGTPTRHAGTRLDADRRYVDALLAGRDPDDPRDAAR